MKELECKDVICGLPPVLTKDHTVSLDLELTGLREEQLHRPAGDIVSLACSFDGETAYMIFDSGEVAEFLERIKDATWIFHNSTFDIGHLRRWAKVPERKEMRDTLLIERILWADYYDDFGLNDLVRRYLGCYMDKSVRDEFSEFTGRMTQEQIKYAALDVIGTWLVDKEQQKILDKESRLVWERIDLPAVWTALDLSGFTIDREKWLDLAYESEDIVQRIETDLGQEFGHEERKMRGRGSKKEEVAEFIPFNPASSAQVVKVLNAKGINVESSGDEVLQMYAGDSFVDKIITYRQSAKRASTYGRAYMKFVDEDGRIYTSLNVIGASSGRFSSRSPNMQQIPRDKSFRECFIAGYKKKLIIADYSAQEPRIFASITKDEKLIEIFNSGKDLYCEVARLAFDEIITKKDKERRNQIKALVLGLMYGLSPFGFARDNEVFQEVAQDMFDRFFEAFPTAANWIHNQTLTNGGVAKSMLGRKGHLHPYNRQWMRNALNYPMQSSGADMVKLAMKEFRKQYKTLLEENKVGIVLPVHDEIILWVVEELADEMKVNLENVMCKIAEMIHVGVPASIEAHVADSWAEK